MRALLLDFGGVVHRSALEMLPDWATRAGLPQHVSTRSGPFGSAVDELWVRMQRGQLSERQYWLKRAQEIGKLLGERWGTPDLLLRLAEGPESRLVRPEAAALLDAAHAAGLRTAVLSNDLAHFHGEAWVARQAILKRFHAVVDGSVTGVLKPDPQAYLLAANALDVAVTDIVFIDDQPWNIAGAREAGLTAVHLDIVNPAPAFAAARRALGLPMATAVGAGNSQARQDPIDDRRDTDGTRHGASTYDPRR